MRKEILLIPNLKGAEKGITEPIKALKPDKIAIANNPSGMQLNDQNNLSKTWPQSRSHVLGLKRKAKYGLPEISK